MVRRVREEHARLAFHVREPEHRLEAAGRRLARVHREAPVKEQLVHIIVSGQHIAIQRRVMVHGFELAQPRQNRVGISLECGVESRELDSRRYSFSFGLWLLDRHDSAPSVVRGLGQGYPTRSK